MGEISNTSKRLIDNFEYEALESGSGGQTSGFNHARMHLERRVSKLENQIRKMKARDGELKSQRQE